MTPCPMPHKVSYETRASAESTRRFICRRMDANRSPERRPVRSYLCPCGKWHLTSKAAEVWLPDSPITPRRREHWARVQEENGRANLERPWPWTRRSEAA